MEWSKETPSKPGFYWFFGYPEDSWKTSDPQFMVVEIVNEKFSKAMGAFFFPDKSTGLWIPMETPSLPSDTHPDFPR
jgi:hypothetical protein